MTSISIHSLGNNKATATASCPFCGKLSSVEVDDLDSLENWANGEGLIQDMLPNLLAEDREILISGICKKCQSKLFN